LTRSSPFKTPLKIKTKIKLIKVKNIPSSVPALHLSTAVELYAGIDRGIV
jgi:hypothetical protein